MLAVANGRYKATIQLLREMGANIEAVDGKGRTPLSIAIEMGRGLVQLLLDKGDSLNFPPAAL